MATNRNLPLPASITTFGSSWYANHGSYSDDVMMCDVLANDGTAGAVIGICREIESLTLRRLWLIEESICEFHSISVQSKSKFHRCTHFQPSGRNPQPCRCVSEKRNQWTQPHVRKLAEALDANPYADAFCESTLRITGPQLLDTSTPCQAARSLFKYSSI